MVTTPPLTLSLRTKFIIFICAIISAFYLFMLYRTSVFDEAMILKQAEQQARMLYKQILLTRQWASDHNGLFILERQGQGPNPYLDQPTVKDSLGNSYYLRNPAMITRELSTYAKRDGLGHFKVTSLDPVNPQNSPDEFEKRSLNKFIGGTKENIEVLKSDMGRVLRFMAPLHVSNSCLGCHARHGYGEGDIRGGLSITIPITWADDLILRNIHSLVFLGVLSIVFVTIALFLMFESLIVHRIRNLNTAMDHFPQAAPEQYLLPSVFKDEIDSVSDNFVTFCDRLNKSQDELLKTKSQAHLNEKMASLGILSAGIAHEVNNPLGGMLNCVKSIRENPDDTKQLERYLPLLEKGLRQIETTMRQLLNFGRTEPLKVRKVDINTLLEECTQLLSFKSKNIQLTTTVSISGEHLLDAEALKQIIINIGLNAIQAMRHGGTLTIGCRELNNQLELTFQDTGTGIAEENLTHIFDPFFTTKEVGEGTGLGLSVSYSLVKRMGGDIMVHSMPGQGTLFTIMLPTTKQAVTDFVAKDD
ncbi:ATP-binding protein [Desulforhopalus singaporensis]|uniref:histidine kinase n=1 Tax=Desulforhopalus singaporensis TaxID=91360 RepID=A0A1H0TGX3_9BACT|nr:ATP-binding protein [Desulforhopalus singaporensis]SDP53312.1 Signal transduction histidine kinase [Desulforhopalus singaporensis]